MKKNKTPLAITIGSTLISGLATTPIQADTFSTLNNNPFKISELSNGYMQTAEVKAKKESTVKKKDGSCGEGKCGSSLMGGSEEKTSEGSCAGNKPMPKPVAKKIKQVEKIEQVEPIENIEPIESIEKSSEGKCGEGKCGSM